MAWHTPRTWAVGELVTKVMLDEQIRDNMNYLLSASMPVGIVITLGVSTNPATLFGFGTWTAIAGKVIVGINAGDAEFDTLDETGGAKTVSLTGAQNGIHTHTQDAHAHTIEIKTATGTEMQSVTGGTAFSTTTTPGVVNSTTATNQNSGSGAPHDNLQPYIVKYVWQRTA